MLHAIDYKAAIHLNRGSCVIGHVAYPEYPVAVVSTPSYVACIEGRITSVVQADLVVSIDRLAQVLLAADSVTDKFVREWLLEHDGDYLIVIAPTDGTRIWVLTDPLGRLPVYFAATDRGLWVGRECKFVVSARGEITFDRIGWAQHLWIGYPLGERTLFKDVHRAAGGLLLEGRVECGTVTSSWRKLWVMNCEVKNTSTKDVRDFAADLVNVFVKGVGYGVGNRASVMALSGGHDSRAVAAALAREEREWKAVSFVTASGGYRADAEIARRIAEVLEVEWTLVQLKYPSEGAAARLVWLKDGLNYVGMAFILHFLDGLVSSYGRAAGYVTGDGGDKIMPDLRPDRPIRDMGELSKAVIREHAILPAATAECIMGVVEGQLEEELGQLLRGYPEDDLAQKGIHFKLAERGSKWLFEGEDRNRFFMWQVSPFYYLPTFRLAMSVPDRLKANHLLYIEFQKQLNPTVAHIPNADYKIPMDSRWFPLLLKGRALVSRLPAGVKAAIRSSSRWVTSVSSARRYRSGSVTDILRAEHGSIMSDEHVSGMLAEATERQRRNWETLAIMERLWSGGPANGPR